MSLPLRVAPGRRSTGSADSDHALPDVGSRNRDMYYRTREITFQRTKTRKESTDPDRDTKLAGLST